MESNTHATQANPQSADEQPDVVLEGQSITANEQQEMQEMQEMQEEQDDAPGWSYSDLLL